MSRIRILDASTGDEQTTLVAIDEAERLERINSDYELQFTAFIDERVADYISGSGQYIIEENDDFFDIVYYKKGQTASGELIAEVECEHVSYRLNNPEYNLEFFTEIGTPETILHKILQGTDFTVGEVEFDTQVVYSLQESASRRFCLMDFIDYLGGEVYFHQYEVSILKRRGSEDVKDLTAGRNMEIIDKVYNKRERDSEGNPLIAYTCQLIEPMEINLGDTVTLSYPKLDIDVELRVVSLSVNPYDMRSVEFEIGNFVPGLEDDARKIELETLKKEKSYYGIRISPEYGFESIKSDASARAVFNADELAMQKKNQNGGWIDVLYFDPEEKEFKFNGLLSAEAIEAIKAQIDVVVSNTIITQVLSAKTGYIAELTVDEFNSSKKVAKYLEADTSDVNYIHIVDEKLEWITAVTDGSETEQAIDRYGQQLYWEDSDKENVTSEETPYPVLMYVYEELNKGHIILTQNEQTLQYDVELKLGAGTDEGDNGKFYIRKKSTGPELEYLSSIDGSSKKIVFADNGILLSPGINPVNVFANESEVNIDGISPYQFIMGINAKQDIYAIATISTYLYSNSSTSLIVIVYLDDEEILSRTFSMHYDGDSLEMSAYIPEISAGEHQVKYKIYSMNNVIISPGDIVARVQQFPMAYEEDVIVNDNSLKFTVNGSGASIPIDNFYLDDDSYELEVDWGDGTIETFNNDSTICRHYYDSTNTWQISVRLANGIGSGAYFDFAEMTSVVSVDTAMPRGFRTTTFSTFNGCTKLESIVPDFFKYCDFHPTIPGPEAVTHLERTFRQCTRLVQVPDLTMFTEVTELNETFYYCSSLVGNEDMLNGLVKVTNMDSTFSGCTSLKFFPKGIVDMPLLMYANQAFKSAGIEYIPEGLFANKSNFKEARSMFQGTSIKAIPSDFFHGMPNGTRVTSLFQSCSNLYSLPEYLFGTFMTESFDSMFRSCSNLYDVSNYLFQAENRVTTSIDYMFSATAISYLPSQFFARLKALKYARSVLEYSPYSASIIGMFAPSVEDLSNAFGSTGIMNAYSTSFSGLTNLKNISNIFSYCNSLSEVGEGILDPCPLTTVEGMFMGCYLLKTVPRLTTVEKAQITSVRNLFRYAGLETIDENVFADMPNLENLEYTFSDTRLNVPANLFAHNSKIKTLEMTFMDLEADSVPSNLFQNLTGEVIYRATFYRATLSSFPHGIMDGTNPSTLYYMFADNQMMRGDVDELWNDYSSTQGRDCFYKTTGVSNYNSIPYDWK